MGRVSSREQRNPYFELGKSRRYGRVRVGFVSERAFRFLTRKIGKSAATTYLSQREWGGLSVVGALAKARAQVKALGVGYPGGFDCTEFRRHD